MTDIFKDIIPSILHTKKNVLEEEKDYAPFIVNRAISYHYDCILFANQMNSNPHLDKKLQYDYYINKVRPYKRPYQKWQKREESDRLDLVKEYYGYSNERAKEALTILTDVQIDEIKRRLYKGGLNDKSRKSSGGKASRAR